MSLLSLQVPAFEGTMESIPIMLMDNRSEDVLRLQLLLEMCLHGDMERLQREELIQELLNLQEKQDMSPSADRKCSGKP